MELFKANQQWKSRPKDERFPTVQALYEATKAYAEVAREKEVPFSSLRTEAVEGEVHLVGKAGVPARLTNWAFGQLAARVGAPAAYLRELPATLAVQNLNHGLKEKANESIASLLFHTNGSLLLRALTSTRYERIWNWEIAERLLGLGEQGWEPAVPDKALYSEEELGVTALYASDHNMFAFLRNKNAAIQEQGTEQPIYRGIIAENSEVGASKLRLTRFGYRYMCGNHIIWGASNVTEIALRHVGSIREKFEVFATEVKKYAEESVSDEEAKIQAAQHKLIAATKEEVLDALFGKRTTLSRKTLEGGYEAVNEEQDGDPRTVWGFVQGLTRYSQTVEATGGYADERTAIDRAAGKILELAF